MILKTTVHAFQLRMSNHRVKKKIRENIEERKMKEKYRRSKIETDSNEDK